MMIIIIIIIIVIIVISVIMIATMLQALLEVLLSSIVLISLAQLLFSSIDSCYDFGAGLRVEGVLVDLQPLGPVHIGWIVLYYVMSLYSIL